MALDTGKIRDFVQKTWDQSIVPTLHEYVKIPAKSPMFDAQWREHGHIDRAVELLRGWASERPIEGLRIEVVRLEGRTPVIFMEAPGTGTDTVLLYGHLDKQRSEEHTSELQSRFDLVCRLLLEKKNKS